MFNRLSNTLRSPSQIARTFRRLGWIGFWSQIILGLIPIVLMIFQGIFSSKSQLTGVPDSGNILSFIDILTLLFTIYWCFRYTRLASKLENSNQLPPKVRVTREVWIGIIANLGVILLAVLIGMITVGGLLYVILSLPPGAATILQPAPGGALINPGPIIVPMDILGLLAIMNVILAGLIGVIVSLRLLSCL
ncbi:Protein of unknown function (DUF3611) [Xenococcus sp. PCC 7305]|uniref:DUF3611 family protein n=1 Tax=Xenococcus sp. PCC 7305 TaxID=102125 RepID=UPI0002AC1C51|nr:DUF3611 family protein [Xenococcus sp. PCC 7305]ELS04234.1 Protein of unknown function (DUF3611) [Xenococcus sp. PCC 7305]